MRLSVRVLGASPNFRGLFLLEILPSWDLSSFILRLSGGGYDGATRGDEEICYEVSSHR